LNSSSRLALVTGGAGFIGSHLVDKLVDRGCPVRVLDDLSTGNIRNIRTHVSSGAVELVKGDVRDKSLVDKCVRDVDFVFHLAAQTSVPLSVEKPEWTFDVNVTGTLNVLTASAKEQVDRLMLASSCAVYGEPKYLPVDEKHPTCPISPYAETKLAGERYCLGFDERGMCGCVVLRFFNVYGPRQGFNDYSGVITRFFERAQKGLPLVVYGDGLQTRDFVSVFDVVDAVLASVEKREAAGKVLNVGSGKSTSIKELAETILKMFHGANVPISFAPPREGDIRDSYADISTAERVLGYSPKVSLADGLSLLLVEKTSGFRK